MNTETLPISQATMGFTLWTVHAIRQRSWWIITRTDETTFGEWNMILDMVYGDHDDRTQMESVAITDLGELIEAFLAWNDQPF